MSDRAALANLPGRMILPIMHPPRHFVSGEHFVASPGEPLRTVVCATADAVIVAWHLDPGQTIPAHIHPHGQDSWTILEGEGAYRTDASGATVAIRAGDLLVARPQEVHGVTNTGTGPLRFISVVSPGEAGYVRLG